MTGIVNATRRGKQLTEKLMTLARANPPAREVFDANDAINGLLPMIRSIVGKRIDVVAMPCPQAAWIRMDVAEFEASVLNIAKNAGDAMTDEGTFRIEIDAVDHDVRLRFTDNGSGIPQDVVARVFEPFFTTKPATHGTGIGLAVVYRVISESGGRIDVSSASGQGTCFTMRLPLHEAPQFAGALPA